MVQYDPIKTSKDTIKNRIPSKSNAEIDQKMKGMLWIRNTDTTAEFVPGSFDETIFNGPNEFDPPHTAKKAQILIDLFTEFNTTYKFMVSKITAAIIKFEKKYPPAKFVRLSSEWVDLIISYENYGVSPEKPLLHQTLNVRLMSNSSENPAVSDTKDFKNYVDIEDVKVLTNLRKLSG